jgi:hypothetical protein
VSIQIGVGGWQPIDAETVDRLSYGDCKALTNYMRVLLDEAGIDAYYTLVKAGSDAPDIRYEFPSNQFNHAILCVPVQEDTVWLECTSQRSPFGYIGEFTDDRHVVVINEEGGIVCRTKTYDESENQKISKVSIELDTDGNTSGKIFTEYRGTFYDSRRRAILSDEHDMKQFIRKELHIPNFELQDVEVTQKKKRLPSIYEHITLTTTNYATRMGDRMIIKLNYEDCRMPLPNQKNQRDNDILIRRSTVETDTIEFVLPEGYAIDKTSNDRTVDTEFGHFSTSVHKAGDRITYTRLLKMNKGTYPAEKYPEFLAFLREVRKSNEDRAVLKQQQIATSE